MGSENVSAGTATVRPNSASSTVTQRIINCSAVCLFVSFFLSFFLSLFLGISDHRVPLVTCNIEVSLSDGDFVRLAYSRGAHILPKARGFLKILGTRWVTWKFHNENYEM